MRVFAVGVVLGLGLALLLRGFTVDDALILAGYAASWARGDGHVFRAGGPTTDGVTPLPLVPLLSLLSRGDVLATFDAIRWLGLVATALASGLVLVEVVSVGDRRGAILGAATWFVSMPVFAWASAGLETGLLPLFVAGAIALLARGREHAASVVLGTLAACRHELLPFALVLALLHERGDRFVLSPRHFVRIALVVAPVVIVVATRLAVFGRPMPLSIVAKAPVVGLGAQYALACVLLTGTTALLAPIAFRRASPATRALVAGAFSHVVAVGFAGGDWMPFARLFVPIMPAVAIGAAALSMGTKAWIVSLRFAVSLGGELFVWKHAARARGVDADRRALIAAAKPQLLGARAVATIDVGWVSVATPARIVDLAGVTDPTIAVLPGGHTQKAIPDEIVDARSVDAFVFQVDDRADVATPWTDTAFARGVERYIAHAPGMARRFVGGESFGDRARYVVIRRRDVALPEEPTPGPAFDGFERGFQLGAE